MSDDNQNRHAPDAREARERYRCYHDIVAEFGKRALSEYGLDAVLQAATEEVSRGINVRRVKVMEHRPETDDFLVRAGVGWKPGVVGRATLPNGRASPPGRAFLDGEPVYIDDLPGSDEYERSDLLARHGIVSLINVPIKIERSTWGILEVDSDEPRHFNEDDCQFLAGFATLLATAIKEKQRRAEEAAHALDREVLLREREVLFHELQHRVANNFQALIGLLEIESRKTADATARAGFERVLDHLASLLFTHEQLSLQQIEQDIDLGFYLRSLVGNLRTPEHVTVIRAIGDAMVPLRTAVRLGLIVNELLTNSLKHAFAVENGGTITVTFTPDVERGLGRLVVADNGRGPEPARHGGSGTRLVDLLVEQIGGAIARTGSRDEGTKVRVDFPLVR